MPLGEEYYQLASSRTVCTCFTAQTFLSNPSCQSHLDPSFHVGSIRPFVGLSLTSSFVLWSRGVVCDVHQTSVSILFPLSNVSRARGQLYSLCLPLAGPGTWRNRIITRFPGWILLPCVFDLRSWYSMFILPPSSTLALSRWPSERNNILYSNLRVLVIRPIASIVHPGYS